MKYGSLDPKCVQLIWLEHKWKQAGNCHENYSERNACKIPVVYISLILIEDTCICSLSAMPFITLYYSENMYDLIPLMMIIKIQITS